MTANDPVCQICGKGRLREVCGFATLPRITSDCRAHAAGGSLQVCLACGGVQKLPDAQWLREIAGIYAGYEAYYQSGGDEQIVFDRQSGLPRRRSDVLLELLALPGRLPDMGAVLDVGCGNGATLTSMSRALPRWKLNGFEISDGALPRLSAIPGFDRLYTGSLDRIDRTFDLVTMVHSLEHFPAPFDALLALRRNVCRNSLFIEVCNIDENPFDILVADHLMHFSPATLARLLRRAGFAPVSSATDWVAKEISLLANIAGSPEPSDLAAVVDAASVHRRLTGYVQWLQRLRDAAMAAAHGDRPFGLFGTSIAATWLAPQLLGKVSFFVDEDSSRIGREHLGRPIVHPGATPQDARIFLALAPGVASAIADRLGALPCSWIMPPSLSD
ncbi:MAG: class I SAM-dependent methyltransferase [Proteobacteria bacterium]|nr:class I SAM-dependent methyltransferase [Pseudomonadota bacterium]